MMMDGDEDAGEDEEDSDYFYMIAFSGPKQPFIFDEEIWRQGWLTFPFRNLFGYLRQLDPFLYAYSAAHLLMIIIGIAP